MSAKVLIIESSRSLALMLTSFCKEHEAVCEVHEGMGSTLESIQQHEALAAITVSYRLVDGDGISLIYSIRALSHLACTPIFFLTSDDNPETARTALVAGATEVFKKAEISSVHQALKAAVIERDLPAVFTGRVLIVEDSEAIARLLIRSCEELGLEVDTVNSAESAFRMFREKPYQLAVIDVILSGTQTGIDLVRNIRRLPDSRSRTPILVTSGYNDTARRIELLRSGTDDFIGKPLIYEELFWRIRNLLQRSRWESEESPAVPDPINDIQLLRQRYRLSSRETEIAAAIVQQGLSDKEIAKQFGISFWTVRTHINHILSKTDTFNRANLTSRVKALRDSSRSGSPMTA